MMRSKVYWGALVVAAFVAGGCAEERAPINRVQANALDKSFFVGKNLVSPEDDPEFYAAATVIDVPYGVNHGLFSGQAGGLKRLKWEITEDKLIARATYETYDGVDGRGSKRTNNGEVIAAFPITAHFDIKRSYNPSTGEELNVIEENTTDRPWNERQYFRADWSTNLITSSIWWDPLAQNAVFGDSGYTAEPLAYYVNDPGNPDAPVFATSEGYFDVTQKIFVTPMTLTRDGQTVPTCFWPGHFTGGTFETGVCESSEIKVRMSFLKLKSPGDIGYQEYEPKNWDGARMSAFGAFTVDRKGYDNHFGIIDDKWYRFVQRYNIWAESFAKAADGSLIACATDYADGVDPNRDTDGDGTDDECASAGAGSVCNTIEHACTIPYARRQVKTVAWHHHMMDDDEVVVYWSERATEEWDTALRLAVQAARQVECRRTGGASVVGTPFEGKGDCETTFHVDMGQEVELRNVRALNSCWAEKGRRSPDCTAPSAVAAIEPVIAFCHNPVRPTDDAACGKPGLVTRVGDIRYHSINMWRTPENSSPWGFGPSWADPLTGEIIQSSINVYNSVTDRSAQSVIDKARWYAGELTSDQVTSGDYVRNWAGAKASPLAGDSFLMSPEEVDHRLKSLAHATETATNLQQPTGTFTQLSPNIGIDALRQQLIDNEAPPVVGGANRAEFDARIDAIKGTPIEAELVGPMWVEAVGIDPETPAAPDVLDVASPFRSLGFRNVLNFEEAVHKQLAKQGMCMYDNEAVEPSSVIAISNLLNRKFGAYDPAASPGAQSERIQKMWDYVRGKMHYGVLLHEMGHTIGERHNFTSSYDKFNYRPQYWQLRTGDGATKQRVTQRCTSPTTDPTGENCIGPRYYDPMTQAEIENSIYTWAQTTVMDYSGELTHDWLGLGVYDYAAARMFYGDVVDVRPDLAFTCDENESNVCVAETAAAREAFGLVDFPGGLVSQTVDVSGRTLHYSEWNDFFPLVAGCRAASSQDLDAPAWWDADRYGAWDAVFDAEVINNEVCERPATQFYQWRELRPDTVSDARRLGEDPQYFTPRRPVTRPDAAKRSFLRVPYSFQTDDRVDGWAPSTLTRDAGADVYEETLWFLHQYENGHIWRNFRNHRTAFSIVGAYQGDLTRYHVKLANFAQGLSILHDYYAREIAKNSGLSLATVLNLYEGEGGWMRDSAVAASVVFDHFMRVLTRPQTGPHRLFGGNMFMSSTDRIGTQDPRNFETIINIPNGTSLAGNDVTFGGRPLDSGFEYGRGYWAYDYVNQCGSYYEKTYVFDMLLSAYYRAPQAFFRTDGIDSRWQHSNFGNLFPDGIRRLMGAFLTEDWELFAPRVTATAGAPDLDQDRYPAKPLGWVSYVPAAGPEYCFPSAGNYVCTDTMNTPILPNSPESVALEPEVGYETQKFMALWAYVYQPESEVMDFTDMMRIWKVGDTVNPDLAGAYIQWTDPESGLNYYAKRYGDEVLLGKTYDKGIAAKMLQWANKLSAQAYVLDPTTPNDPITGAANYVRDASGNPIVAATASTAQGGACADNPNCVQLRKYRGLLDFMTDVAHSLGYDPPELPFN
jgi:hypothetical protein